MRTAVYVDGFNLYYRALKRTSYRWVDLLALSQQMVRPVNKVVLIKYFTARVKSNAYKPDQHVRQDAYLRAIKAHIPCLQVYEGQFYQHKVRMPLAHPPASGPRTVEVIKSEEKGSDVNLAVHLVNDAWSNLFDVALVISNDSDLAEAVNLARSQGKPVGVVNPSASDKMCYELHRIASFKRRIEAKHLRRSQMPDPVRDATGGVIHKPVAW
ncbi:NYN domain-containing protein [Oleiagrimonas sp. MCCC 1A03011]|uniref:NYN domain-containing protein n=1 Tax=Oleiagrimonas sp. MCCC 1A03011 TaxID=1926883 RepID=UPI000DC5D08C|nr:NYN domain-containing protein [Oleiagrimonas sp. MCCC 1A03011]RAP58371.1 hypothetical protein BTJ49_05330 [Oleiagrimonas sp. MCCC 1A03011]